MVHRLEENHGLLTQMAGRDDGSEASSELPKLLLELVSQVDEGEERITKVSDTKDNKIVCHDETCNEGGSILQNA